MTMLFMFLLLFIWFIRLAILAAGDFVGVLSTKQTILAVLEMTLFFTIVFNVINHRFSIEQQILDSVNYKKENK